MKATALLATLAILSIPAGQTMAIDWALAGDGSWNAAASWNPQTVPNAVGANATFNGSATGQTANRSIALDATQTVGSILFNVDVNFNNNIVTGTGTPPALRFDNGGAGATITTQGSGTGNSTISGSFRLDDNLTAFVNQTTSSSAAGSLNMTGVIQGTGGFTKLGDGLATFGTGTKQFTGPMVIGGGRMRISSAAQPSAVSSFTINNGGQLTLITNNSTFTFGSGTLNLNGAGPTTGPFAVFPGAIRNDTNITTTITNAVNLQSTTTIHVQGTTSGSTTLSGAVSGIGGLIAGANPHDANLGQLVLSGTNSYAGGSTARAGNLVAASTSTTAFGIGNVTVESASLIFGGSTAKVTIASSASNAISDLATLSLAGGNAVGVADDGFIDLGAGIDETIGGLILGGTPFTAAGTYGSSSSGADFQFDEFFAGSGVVRLLASAGTDGDYNDDGVVDAADYVVFRKFVGQTSTLPNDPNGGTVDVDQYNTWRQHFAEGGSGRGGSGAVPEPAGFILASMAAASVAARLRSPR